MKRLLLIFVLNLVSTNLFSQEITGKILSKNKNLPIENVSIISDLQTGTTSDANGKFTISVNKIKFLRFSFLGFEPKKILIDDLKKMNYTIYLSEITNQLDEVKIISYTFSLDSLLKKTNHSMNKNYYDTIIQQDMFLMKSDEFKFKNLSIELKSNNNKAIYDQKKMQTDLNKFTQDIVKNSVEKKAEFSGTFVAKKIRFKNSKEIYHLVDFKKIEGYAIKTQNDKNSFVNVQNELQGVILRNINQKNSYKVKSGLFKVEDSLALDDKSFLNDSVKKNSFNKSQIERFKSTTENIGTFFRKTDEVNYLNPKFYQHKLENTIVSENQKIYVVSFSPKKSSAKYQGKMFINAADFTLSKINIGFANGKRGEHLNLKMLLGVKFEENLHDISIHYQKLDNGNIIVSYVKEKKSKYIYANRPFKFIENSASKNKLKFNFKSEMIHTESFEILFKNPSFLSKMEVKQKDKDFHKKRTPFLTKEEYSKTTWKNRKEIEEYLNINQ